MKLLKDLADIRSGYPFRDRPDRSSVGGIAMVQMSDIKADQPWVAETLEQIEPPDNWEKHALRAHDVLLTVRGHRNNAAIYQGENAAVAAANLAVLKFKGDALPQYLTWCLNLPQTQEQLRALRTGSNIPFLPIEALGQMKIPVPSMDRQQHIVELYKLWHEEQQLMTQVLNKRRELMAGVFQCLLTNDRTG